MNETNAIFVIPGYQHKPSDPAYKKIARVLKSEGYNPILVDVQWENTSISESTESFIKEFKKIKARNKYILGFSFGAMIAFLASTKVTTQGIILCSLSPYFQEDGKRRKSKSLSVKITREQKDFIEFSSAALAKRTKAKRVHMLYGENEDKSLISRVTETYSQILLKQKQLIQIQDTEHEIESKTYLASIRLAAKNLN